MLLDANGIECSTGSACTPGWPRPSHVLLAMGSDEEPPAARCGSPSATPRPTADVDALVEAIGPVVERARSAGRCAAAPVDDSRALMRVLAAMSGGVDSAVAAALAVDAGHDVTGVHMALSRNPQPAHRSRGCCTGRGRLDARRAADLLGIPFYVWDLSERFLEDVVDDFLAEYSAGRTPNPCLRCNEKIKFAALLDRGHRARLRRGGPPGTTPGCDRRRAASCTAPVDMAKDQSYVLAVLTPEQLAHSMFPLGDTCQGRGPRRRPRGAGSRSPQKPDSHDICFIPDGDTHGYLVEKLGAAATGSGRRRRTGEVLGEHDGPSRFTIGQRKGLRIGTPGRRRPAALRARHRAGVRHRHRRPARGARGHGLERDPAPLVRHAAPATRARTPPSCAPTAARPGRGDRRRRRLEVTLPDPASGVAPGQAVVLYDGTRVVGSATIAPRADGAHA